MKYFVLFFCSVQEFLSEIIWLINFACILKSNNSLENTRYIYKIYFYLFLFIFVVYCSLYIAVSCCTPTNLTPCSQLLHPNHSSDTMQSAVAPQPLFWHHPVSWGRNAVGELCPSEKSHKKTTWCTPIQNRGSQEHWKSWKSN